MNKNNQLFIERKAVETLLDLNHEEDDNQCDIALKALFNRTQQPQNRQKKAISQSPIRIVVKTQPDTFKGKLDFRQVTKQTIRQTNNIDYSPIKHLKVSMINQQPKLRSISRIKSSRGQSTMRTSIVQLSKPVQIIDFSDHLNTLLQPKIIKDFAPRFVLRVRKQYN